MAMRVPVVFTAALLISACDTPPPANGPVTLRDQAVLVADHDEDHEAEPSDPDYFSDAPVDPLTSYDCNEKQDTGYVKGDPYPITVVTVDGKPVEVETANAYLQMRAAAAADGVNIKVVSGFRTMAQQQYLYNCYINCNCNNCNLAAKPGYSNHQSGHALDVNTGVAAVNNWLKANGGKWGFKATVPSEAWHWEWWGEGPPADGPCGKPSYKASYVAQSFPPAAEPALLIELGASIDAWIELKNDGKATWTSNTRLAPTPRDEASPLVALDWMSPTRITGPDADTPAGQVGRFGFQLTGNALGEYYQTFGLVEEGVTWFSDKPLGGGPPDTQLEVRIMVVEPPPSPSESTGEVDDTGEPPTGETDETGASDPTLPDGTGGGGSDGQSGGDTEQGPPTTGDDDSAPGDSGAEPLPTGPGLPADYGVDDGCGCRSPGSPGSPGTLGLVVFGLLLARRRRAA